MYIHRISHIYKILYKKKNLREKMKRKKERLLQIYKEIQKKRFFYELMNILTTTKKRVTYSLTFNHIVYRVSKSHKSQKSIFTGKSVVQVVNLQLIIVC